ncbi:MAG: DoxX family protein [Gemmatimonadaceae bacterium]|nr:DoxX family protein [Gemmatimonadaceae bacterium]
MHSPDSRAIPSNSQLWTGRVLSGLAVIFLAFDTAIKFAHIGPVTTTMAQLGIPDHFVLAIAIIQAICLVLYVIPRTAALGAILFTGYLGGAILANLRVENPLFSHVLFPTYIGTLLWVGLYLRDTRVRTLIS